MSQEKKRARSVFNQLTRQAERVAFDVKSQFEALDLKSKFNETTKEAQKFLQEKSISD